MGYDVIFNLDSTQTDNHFAICSRRGCCVVGAHRLEARAHSPEAELREGVQN